MAAAERNSMNRAETAKFLSKLQVQRFGNRTYWAKEVSIDYGTNRVKRVDFMQFAPAGLVTRVILKRAYLFAMKSKAVKRIYILAMTGKTYPGV